jgi:hypothetical protein
LNNKNFTELLIENTYNPFQKLEKSRDIDEVEYEKLNCFKYFMKFDSLVAALSPKYKSNEGEIDSFMKCLCKIYIGHNIHQRINNEISKKTNLYILKGDYFFSLGYYTVTKIGHPLLIKVYSKIAENFAKVKLNLNLIPFLF